MCQCALLALTYTIKLIDNAEKEINVSKNYCNYVKRNKISFDYKCWNCQIKQNKDINR